MKAAIDNLINFNNRARKLTPCNASFDKCRNALDGLFDMFSKEKSLAYVFEKMNANPEFEQVKSGLYSMDDIFVHIGSKCNMEDTLSNLYIAKNCELSCAPKIIDWVLNDGGKYQMMAVKMPKYTKPYAKHKDCASFEQRAKFLSEIRKLTNKTERYNSCILDEKNWFLKENGDIFIYDWSTLNSFENNAQKREYYNTIAKKLGLMFY